CFRSTSVFWGFHSQPAAPAISRRWGHPQQIARDAVTKNQDSVTINTPTTVTKPVAENVTKPPAALADLQTEVAQDSPNAQFHVQQPSEKLLARNQQRPDLLRSNRFGVHLLEPSHPQQLCKPTRILAVRLHCHRRQGRLHMPRLQQNGLKSCLRQPGMQPL